jgi:amidohydrolase
MSKALLEIRYLIINTVVFLMRTICTLFLTIFTLSAADAQDMRARLDQSIAGIEPQVVEWRRDLHRNPELSNREFRTAEKMADHLRRIGVDKVETGVAHTGVIGTLVGGKPGPVIALRADMDGLPVREQTGLPFASTATGEYNGAEVPVMHACGHDTHMAMLMGAAAVLAEHRDELRGTVKFVFQPAEEGPPLGEKGGASLMVEEGFFAGDDPPEAMIGLHAWPAEHGTINYRSGPMMAAADSLYITVIGEQTHGSSPWLGVDPIHVATQIVNAIQGIPSRHVDVTRGPAVITIGSIQGGVRGNIIPDRVEMMGTIRTFDAGEREKLHVRLRETVTKIAEANGATAEVVIDGAAPVTGNDPALLRAMMPSLEWAAGEENVREVRPITGAEDFSFFQAHVPSLFLLLGIADPGVPYGQAPSNHSPFFDANEDALIVGVRALVAFAMDYADAAGR